MASDRSTSTLALGYPLLGTSRHIPTCTNTSIINSNLPCWYVRKVKIEEKNNCCTLLCFLTLERGGRTRDRATCLPSITITPLRYSIRTAVSIFKDPPLDSSIVNLPCLKKNQNAPRCCPGNVSESHFCSVIPVLMSAQYCILHTIQSDTVVLRRSR